MDFDYIPKFKKFLFSFLQVKLKLNTKGLYYSWRLHGGARYIGIREGESFEEGRISKKVKSNTKVLKYEQATHLKHCQHKMVFIFQLLASKQIL